MNVNKDAKIGEILLKGDARGVRLVVPEDLPSEKLASSLDVVLGAARHILSGARVLVDLQGRACSREEIVAVLDRFVWPGNVQVASWISYHKETLSLLRQAGLPTGEPASPISVSPKQRPPLLLLQRSLRSGQCVPHDGDVVIAGHVNDGAEVFAGGNIVVWGRLQGLAHAGEGGDASAQILVRSFEAPQVRVGRKVSYVDRDVPWWGKSVVVALENDAIVVRPVTVA